MNALELVVTERNRLVRTSIIVGIVALILAIWARDPHLEITTPFSGSNAGNITVGHAVLIGHPVICILFFVLIAQMVRFHRLLSELKESGQISELEFLHFNLRTRKGAGYSLFLRAAASIGEGFRWFCIVALPALASVFLLDSQFDFKYVKKSGEWVPFSVDLMFDSRFNNQKLSYMSLAAAKNCDKIESSEEKRYCYKQENKKKRILERMPKVYQPYNFLFGSILQLCVLFCLAVSLEIYFGIFSRLRSRATDGLGRNIQVN